MLTSKELEAIEAPVVKAGAADEEFIKLPTEQLIKLLDSYHEIEKRLAKVARRGKPEINGPRFWFSFMWLSFFGLCIQGLQWAGMISGWGQLCLALIASGIWTAYNFKDVITLTEWFLIGWGKDE